MRAATGCIWRGGVLVLLAPLVLLTALGCGEPKIKLATLEGTVLSGGKPLPKGCRIVFSDWDKGISIAAELDDQTGAYKVSMAEGFGLPPGTYGVAVLPPDRTPTPEMMEKFR